jgi:hypothetical protein
MAVPFQAAELRRETTPAPGLRTETRAGREPLDSRETALARSPDAVPSQPLLAAPQRVPHFEPVPTARKGVANEPVIQVTIGRIEVRAVSEPTARGREQAESPVMSLGDYLKQHCGGGKR